MRIGVGRPDSTDPEIVSAHVLGAFREPKADVADLVDRAARRRRGDRARRARAGLSEPACRPLASATCWRVRGAGSASADRAEHVTAAYADVQRAAGAAGIHGRSASASSEQLSS